MKADYLSELLKNNKTVIFPGIGAFTDNPSSVPAIAFNPYLKFNDGLLISFISKKENISAEDAGKKLEVFTNGLISLLESGRDVAVKNLGKLKMDASGKIYFTYDSTSTETILPVEEKPKQEPVKEIIEEKKPEVKIIPEEKPVVKEEVKIKEEKIPAPVSKPEIKVEKETVTTNHKPQTINGEAKLATASETSRPPQAKKKIKKLIRIIVLIVILGGTGTAGYLYKDQVMELIGMNEEKTAKADEKTEPVKEKIKEEKTEEPVITSDTIIPSEDSLATEPELSPDTDEKIRNPKHETQNTKLKTRNPKHETPNPKHETISASSGTYYVIVGCYREQSNADAMMAKITEKGHQPVNLGTYNGLIHIAAFQSADMHEAANKAMQMRSEYGKVWIFQQK